VADGVSFRKGEERPDVEPTSVRPRPDAASSPTEPPRPSKAAPERPRSVAIAPEPVEFAVSDRWSLIEASPARRRGLAWALGAALVSALALGSLLTSGSWMGRGAATVLGGLSLGVLVGLGLRRLLRRKDAEAAHTRSLTLESDTLTLSPRAPEVGASLAEAALCRVELGERFGLTLLSNRRRDRLVALVTTPHGTLPVATRVDPNDPTIAPLLLRAGAMSEGDNALFAAGPDGRSVLVDSRSFRSLVDQLLARDSSCLGRMVLSDQAGRPLIVEEDVLVALGHRFDLRRPLEWRPIHFQEVFGSSVTYYQGTWVRQGPSEVVFVSLLPPSFFEGGNEEQAGHVELDTLSARDLRLLSGAMADPPPMSQRVALEGLFVLPMRTALDRAPRALDRSRS
jgi:hypothetical protein